MAEQVNIASPVKVESDSKERVAFDLALKIADYSQVRGEDRDKKYWLSLYRQCLKAVRGHDLKSVLLED